MRRFITNKSEMNRERMEVALSCAILLFLWELLAFKINNDIYLPTISQVIQSLIELIVEPKFYLDILFSIGRCFFSFAIAMLVSLFLGGISYISNIIRNFLKPITNITKSIPTMIVIVLALIWFNKDSAPFIVAFIMVFPILYESILDSMLSIDKGILEMANVYGIGWKNKVLKIYLPSIKFRLISIMGSTFSLALKVVIAGEVYGQPKYGMGTQIQIEKINFNTSGIFAWIIVVVIITFILENFQKPIQRSMFIWKR